MKSDFAWTQCYHVYGNGCQHIGRVITVATGDVMFTSGMAVSLCRHRLFLTLRYQEQQSGTDGSLFFVASEGFYSVVIDSRDGIRWAGVILPSCKPQSTHF